MLKKLALCFSLLLVAVAATGIVSAQDTETTWTCPEGLAGQTLKVFNWSTYIAEETIPRFEELCDVEVDYQVFASNEEMITVIREGSVAYDLVAPTDYTVEIMIAEGLLRPLNHENIPNIANLSATFTDPAFDPGNTYSVAYAWGTVGIGYDTTVIDEPITTWRQVFEYDGPVAWLDDVRGTYGVALTILGYDPNTQDEQEISEATDFLIENGRNVVAIAGDDGQVMLERGDVDITVEYNGDIFQIISDCECDDFTYIVPEEGALAWVDNMAIPANAEHPELAEAFIDYIMDPVVGAELTNYIAFGSPNQAAIDSGLVNQELLDNPGIYPVGEALENLFVVASVGEAESFYSEGWAEVLANLGQ